MSDKLSNEKVKEILLKLLQPDANDTSLTDEDKTYTIAMSTYNELSEEQLSGEQLSNIKIDIDISIDSESSSS